MLQFVRRKPENTYVVFRGTPLRIYNYIHENREYRVYDHDYHIGADVYLEHQQTLIATVYVAVREWIEAVLCDVNADRFVYATFEWYYNGYVHMLPLFVRVHPYFLATALVNELRTIHRQIRHQRDVEYDFERYILALFHPTSRLHMRCAFPLRRNQEWDVKVKPVLFNIDAHSNRTEQRITVEEYNKNFRYL